MMSPTPPSSSPEVSGEAGAQAPQPKPKPKPKKEGRLFVLDGWRAISILLVLATHMLPVGPKSWQMNVTAGEIGMSLFFTLSGFLITQQLYAKRNIAAFFVRRLFRIVPLAWLYTAVAMLILGAGPRTWAAHLFFYLNYDFPSLTDLTGHFWSLCVEVQFYAGIGLLMVISRFRFGLIPLAWLAFVIVRCVVDPSGAIRTHARVDEILSGACLALIALGLYGPKPREFIARIPFPLLALALFAASRHITGIFEATRGLFASCLIGHTLFNTDPRRFRWLGHRALRYVAEVSYALYVIHPMTQFGWLGTGDRAVKYSKRIISLSLTFGAAHLSTFYFEKPFLERGKTLAARIEKR
jgi:peptidoglycan/LPS O-acetylase OafA/YrhL